MVIGGDFFVFIFNFTFIHRYANQNEYEFFFLFIYVNIVVVVTAWIHTFYSFFQTNLQVILHRSSTSFIYTCVAVYGWILIDGWLVGW